MPERTLATTNPIENINGLIRNRTRNVRRWESGTMVRRWALAALEDAAKGFRRMKGYAGMPQFVAALRARDARSREPLQPRRKRHRGTHGPPPNFNSRRDVAGPFIQSQAVVQQ